MKILATLVLAACASAPPPPPSTPPTPPSVAARPMPPEKKPEPLPTFQPRDAHAVELATTLATTPMDARGYFLAAEGPDLDALNAWSTYTNRPTVEIAETCLALLAEGEPRLQAAGAQCVRSYKDKPVAYLLDALAREHHDGVALQLATALLSAKLEHPDVEAMSALVGAMVVSGAPVRREAGRTLMRALARNGSYATEAMRALVLQLLESTDRELLGPALEMAAHVDQTAVCPVLAKHFEHPKSDDAWDAAVYILTRAPASREDCERYVGDALDIAIDMTANDVMTLAVIQSLDTVRDLPKGMRARIVSRLKAIKATRPASEHDAFDAAITIYSQPRKPPPKRP